MDDVWSDHVFEVQKITHHIAKVSVRHQLQRLSKRGFSKFENMSFQMQGY